METPEKERRFAFRYYYDGICRGLSIPASSKEEARAKIKAEAEALSQAEYDGEIFATIPAGRNPDSWFARLLISILKKIS